MIHMQFCLAWRTTLASATACASWTRTSTQCQAVQLRNGLAPSETLGSMDFTVEMETGTGKTYVYLRSIFELNYNYAFGKFIIVVPSVAIKEGVYKSLQMTEEHFKALGTEVGLTVANNYETFSEEASASWPTSGGEQ